MQLGEVLSVSWFLQARCEETDPPASTVEARYVEAMVLRGQGSRCEVAWAPWVALRLWHMKGGDTFVDAFLAEEAPEEVPPLDHMDCSERLPESCPHHAAASLAATALQIPRDDSRPCCAAILGQA